MDVRPAAPPRLLLVDAHAQAYRAYHAIRHLTGPDGRPTNAIFGFVKAVQKLLARHAPTHVAVVWDGGLAEARLAALPGYKAQRPPMPETLESQLDGMVEWARATGLASLCQDGVEADDRIAQLARAGSRTGVPVLIASSDKDFMQLVDDRISLLNPNDREGEPWNSERVLAKTGVRPDQIIDWLSLIGDTVDNIPGVPGVGPKTATILLQRFGSCDALLRRIQDVTPDRLRNALTAARTDLERNRALIRLDDPSGEPVPLESLERQPPDQPALIRLYRDWGFRSLLDSLTNPPASQPNLL